jgi:shikimate dehydrogenase
VNTIVVRDGRCIGHNTDVAGFSRVLENQGFEPRGKRTLVLGAGGAARAVIYALLRAGAEVVLCNRTLERADALALSFASASLPSVPTVRPLTNSVLEEEIERCQLMVNTTSVGMAPDDGGSPWPEDVPLASGLVVFDLVYAPLETRLLRQARAVGAEVVDGLQMLVCQGVEAFRLWTGIAPPREAMYRAALAAMPVDEQVEEKCSVS